MRAARELLRRGPFPGVASDARCGAADIASEFLHVGPPCLPGVELSPSSSCRGVVRGRGAAAPAGPFRRAPERPGFGSRSEIVVEGEKSAQGCVPLVVRQGVKGAAKAASWPPRLSKRPRGACEAALCGLRPRARGALRLFSASPPSGAPAAAASLFATYFSSSSRTLAGGGFRGFSAVSSGSPPLSVLPSSPGTPGAGVPLVSPPASACGLPSFSELSSLVPPTSTSAEAAQMASLGRKLREVLPRTPAGRRQLALALARQRLKRVYPEPRPTRSERESALVLAARDGVGSAASDGAPGPNGSASGPAFADGIDGSPSGSASADASACELPSSYPSRPSAAINASASLAVRLSSSLAESAWARDQALAIYLPHTLYAEAVLSFAAWMGEAAARSPRLDAALHDLERARRRGSWESPASQSASGPAADGLCADGRPTSFAAPPASSSSSFSPTFSASASSSSFSPTFSASASSSSSVSSLSVDPAEILFPLFARFALATRREEVSLYRARCSAADLRAPHTWYPAARAAPPRRVIYHAGPTNSGKTHRALEAMTNASSGVYAGPLRLLAMEIYDSTNLRGTTCDLVTGQERIEVPGSSHAACTVEMVDLNSPVDVAVLDEIQMIGDSCRGWAWTRALAGLPARELHVCGDSSAVPVVRRICEACGDDLEVRTYERLTPLATEPEPLARQDPRSGGFALVRPGDCVVAFSRRDIFAIRREIELHSGHRACVIYGALPPETRRAQAARFNDPASGRDVLVASDAVGMGLNLNIGRVIFSTTEKRGNDGTFGPVSPSALKQIAGRAGRRKSTWGPGRAAALFPRDLEAVERAIAMPLDGLETQRAGLFPEFEHLELFASQQPGTGFAALLKSFAELARVDDALYFLCRQDGVEDAAALLDGLELSLKDTYTFSVAPAPLSTSLGAAALLRFARLKAAGLPVPLDVAPPSRLPQTSIELRQLELAQQVVDLWLWLAKRFQDPAQWPDADKAAALSHLLCRALDAGIDAVAARERVGIQRIQEQMRGKKTAKGKKKRKGTHDKDEAPEPLQTAAAEKSRPFEDTRAHDRETDEGAAAPRRTDEASARLTIDGDRAVCAGPSDRVVSGDVSAGGDDATAGRSGASAKDAFARLRDADPSAPFADPLVFLAGEAAELDELQSRHQDIPRGKWAQLCAHDREERHGRRGRDGRDGKAPAASWIRRGSDKAKKARGKSAGSFEGWAGRGKSKGKGKGKGSKRSTRARGE